MIPAYLVSRSLAQRRAIALCVLFVALAVAFLGIVWPVFTVIGGQVGWRAEAAERLARYQGLATSQTRIESQLREAKGHPLWAGLLPGSDAAAAANTLQTEFRSMLDALRIPVQSSSPLDARPGERITRVGVRLELQMTIDQLQALLEQAASHSRRFLIDNVTITAPMYQSPEQNASLNVQLEAWGFMRMADSVSSAAR